MKKTGLLLLLVAVAFTAVIPAAAQMDKAGINTPPKLLQIVREEVKPGKDAAHTMHEAAWTRAMVNAKYNNSMLAMTSATGPSEAWFCVGFDSYDGLEKSMNQLYNGAFSGIMASYGAKESEFLEGSRTLIGVYRENLSYKPNFPIGPYKYFTVNQVRVKVGADVADLYKPLNENREKAGLDDHFVVYQVTSGAPSGTYLVFRPLKSLADLDAPPNQTLTDLNRQANLADIAAKVFTGTESRIYAFSPQMSSMPAEVVAANPSFWKPKPVMAKKAAAGAETPAAKKEPEKK